MATDPLKVLTITSALPSPKVPRRSRRSGEPGGSGGSLAPMVKGRSEWTPPLKVLAASSNPCEPARVSRTSPEWLVNS